jgi:hypothetical protein
MRGVLALIWTVESNAAHVLQRDLRRMTKAFSARRSYNRWFATSTYSARN